MTLVLGMHAVHGSTDCMHQKQSGVQRPLPQFSLGHVF